jgi:hypothetical protein
VKTTSTTVPAPQPPGTKPPPTAFGLPLGSGLALVEQRAAASREMAVARAALPADQANIAGAERSWRVVAREVDTLKRQVAATQRRLDVAQQNIRQAAVTAYLESGAARTTTVLSVVANAHSTIDAGRTLRLIGAFGDQQNDVVSRYEGLRRRLDSQRGQLQSRRQAADTALDSARTQLRRDLEAIAHARVRLTAAVAGITTFEKAATSASSPILGPSALTARQLADFVRASGHAPRLTVPLDELARDYIREGDNAAVRGDVAFAQSILETDWFTFPAGGQVKSSDNNFAGMGACDSCAHGLTFRSADQGVRAQMQALRIYVDPTLTTNTLAQPLVMPKMLDLGFRGMVQTWWDLWGTWATGALYGQRVYDIYERMVAFAKTDPAVSAPHVPL